MTAAAALAAWVGGSIIVLADGRRGLSLGLALLTAGLAALAWLDGQQAAAIATLAGGMVAAALRLRRGRDGWGLMEPGSTPRLVLTLVAGLLALWVGASVSAGDGAALRFAALATLGLTGARILQDADRAVVQTAASGLALALGAAAGVAAASRLGFATSLIAAAIAAGVSALSMAEPVGT